MQRFARCSISHLIKESPSKKVCFRVQQFRLAFESTWSTQLILATVAEVYPPCATQKQTHTHLPSPLCLCSFLSAALAATTWFAHFPLWYSICSLTLLVLILASICDVKKAGFTYFTESVYCLAFFYYASENIWCFRHDHTLYKFWVTKLEYMRSHCVNIVQRNNSAWCSHCFVEEKWLAGLWNNRLIKCQPLWLAGCLTDRQSAICLWLTWLSADLFIYFFWLTAGCLTKCNPG